MLEVTIDKKAYLLTEKWDEISLGEFERLCKIECPTKLKDLWFKASDKKEYNEAFSRIIFSEIRKEFPSFYREVILLLSEIPSNVLDILDFSLYSELYYRYLHPFYLSTLLPTPLYRTIKGNIRPYKPRYRKRFVFEGSIYAYPEIETIFGNSIPMRKEKIITFAEAADLEIALEKWSEEGVDAISTIVATYCRPIGEEYNEEKTLKRSKDFRRLDMDTIWRVFFCITNCGEDYQNVIQKFLLLMTIAKAKRRKAAG